MGFNDWIYIEPAPMAIDGRMEEVDALAKEKLAQHLQTRIRGRVDTGLDPRAAHRAQAVRVMAEGGRLVIDERSQDSVLAGTEQPEERSPDERPPGIEGLFTTGSGIPQLERRPDGTSRLVFRQVGATDLFEAQRQRTQDQSVRHAVTDTMQTQLVDAYEDAVREVENRYPAEKL